MTHLSSVTVISKTVAITQRAGVAFSQLDF